MKGVGLVKDFIFLYKNFGGLVAFKCRVLPVLYSCLTSRSYNYYFHRANTSFLKRLLKNIINKYKVIDQSHPTIDIMVSNSPIWTCWWQGEENMPEVIKTCYIRLQKNSNGHPVYLVTMKNVSQFVELPDFILQKVDKGYISFTHLSDILRVLLLEKYGGFWIDAAIWVTKPIDICGFSFFTLKQRTDNDDSITKRCWINGCVASGKGFWLYSFLRESLMYYWEKENQLINYFILDYLMRIAYDEMPNVKSIIDSIPYSCPSIHIMKKIMNHEYDELRMKELLRENAFFSLSWKIPFECYNSVGKPSYYKFFLEYNNEK